VFHSAKDAEKAREVCPVCHHNELVEGRVQGTGLNYFVPKKTKFWTLKDSFVTTSVRMCTRCGALAWFGDTAKLEALRVPSSRAEGSPADPPALDPDSDQPT
jgi:hypothetical protein